MKTHFFFPLDVTVNSTANTTVVCYICKWRNLQEKWVKIKMSFFSPSKFMDLLIGPLTVGEWSPLHPSSPIIFPTPCQEIEVRGGCGQRVAGPGLLGRSRPCSSWALLPLCHCTVTGRPAHRPQGPAFWITRFTMMCGEGVIFQMIWSLPCVEPVGP